MENKTIIGEIKLHSKQNVYFLNPLFLDEIEKGTQDEPFKNVGYSELFDSTIFAQMTLSKGNYIVHEDDYNGSDAVSISLTDFSPFEKKTYCHIASGSDLISKFFVIGTLSDLKNNFSDVKDINSLYPTLNNSLYQVHNNVLYIKNETFFNEEREYNVVITFGENDEVLKITYFSFEF